MAGRDLAELLHQVFGHADFRAHQREVCEAAASGRDVLLVMPTGAGKSLCYQLPALARRAEGATGAALVISPLIALMDDQAAKLAALGLRVARIHSGMDREAARQACRDYLAGELDFLFIAPERMRVPGFPEMLAKRKPALIAIDEAHCISQWGHDFRPDYRMLGPHLEALRPAPIIALTATATPTVQRDIAVQLALREPAVFITGFRRTNLALEVLEMSRPERADFALRVLEDKAARPAIVYAGSRKQAEELAAKLHGKFPAAAYHAGLDAGTRERVQRAFLAGKLEVVVATIAFGMGVDKADVRTVIHVALPGSVEAFYQEIGRAGRDGKPARTILLHGFADRRMQEFFLDRSYPPLSELERVQRALVDEWTPLDELVPRVKMDREALERAVEQLAAAGVAQVDMSGAVRAVGARGWQSRYEKLVAARRAQIDLMVAFAEGSGCRMSALVRHFGESADAAAACGMCDRCRPDDAIGAEAFHAPDATEREELRSILRALEKRSQSTGQLFNELKLRKERKDFNTLLQALEQAGLVAISTETFRNQDGEDVTYRKVAITHEGREPDDRTMETVRLRGGGASTKKRKAKASARRSSPGVRAAAPSRTTAGALATSRAPVQTVVRAVAGSAAAVRSERSAARKVVAEPFSPQQQELEAKLREWRKEQARAAGLPSFFIFSDTALRDIVAALPKTLDDLRAVHGVGPEKLERFGADVLALCRA